MTASRLKRVCRTQLSKPRVSLVKDICYPGNRAFHSKATEWGCDREQTVRQQYCDLMSDMRIPPFRLFSGNIHIMWNLKMPQNLLLQFV